MRYVIAAILALVTYSASAGKGILQHAPYETVGPMLGKIQVGFDETKLPIFSMGTICHDLGIRAVKHGMREEGTGRYGTNNAMTLWYPKHNGKTIANRWFERATVRDYEVEIRYVQYTNEGNLAFCYYYQAGNSSGKAGKWNWRYPQ